MEDESQLTASAQLTLTLAGIAVVGMASCFSGGLALLGLAGLFGYLIATAKPEPEGAFGIAEQDACGTDVAWPPPESPPCPTPAMERDDYWQTVVAARRSSAPDRRASL